MARPRKFDSDTLLERATQVFWEKGYKGTSVQDLVDATGVNRGSLYNTFGDKAGLFAAVMERYAERSAVQTLIEEAHSAPPRKTIRQFFKGFHKRAKSGGLDHGCLVTNTVTELADRDERTAWWLRDNLGALEDAFTLLIRRGQKKGEINPDKKARALARFLVGAAQGILVVSKVYAGPEIVRDIVKTTLSCLD